MNGRSRGQSGFSLIEIVLALGIVSFALVGILGLFPLALDTSQDSKAETIIAFIGQSVMADIEGTMKESTAGSPPVTNVISQIQTQAANTSLDLLSNSTTLYLSYDNEGLCQKALSQSEYDSGTPDGAYIMRLTSEFSPTDHADLTRIQMDIEFPAAAAPQFRKSQSFFRLIRP